MRKNTGETYVLFRDFVAGSEQINKPEVKHSPLPRLSSLGANKKTDVKHSSLGANKCRSRMLFASAADDAGSEQ